MKVELTPRAASALASLPRDDQRLVARRIDAIASRGLPDGAPQAEGPTADRQDAHVVAAGEYRLLCVARDDRLIVASIEAAGDSATQTLQRAAATPLREALSSRVGRALSDLWMDVRFAARNFRRQPTVLAVTVLTLAIGIGGNTAVFGVFSNVFLGELPLRDADRLLRLRNYSTSASGEIRAVNMTPRDFRNIRDRADSLEDVLAMLGYSFTLTGDGAPERIAGIRVSEGMLDALGIDPLVGSGFSAEQEALGTDSGVALIGNALWQRRFGGDPDAVGRTLILDGEPFVISGVMPRDFAFPMTRRSGPRATSPPTTAAATTSTSWRGCAQGCRCRRRATSSTPSPRRSVRNFPTPIATGASSPCHHATSSSMARTARSWPCWARWCAC